MLLLKDVEYTRLANFGPAKTGKTVTASILDNTGASKGSGYTLGSVFELSDGNYGVTLTLTTIFSGFIKWSNTTDGLELYDPIVGIADYASNITLIKKVSVNRWKIASNQQIIYDDDGTTALITFNLFNSGGSADGETPAERVPV